MAERICGRDDVQPGQMGVFQLRGRSIAVARTLNGCFHAIRNVCPHQGAPLGLGFLDGTFLPSEVGEYRYGLDGQIVRCPWHRWEFDVTTGRSLHDPESCRVASYPLRVDGDDVFLAEE